MCEDTIIVSAIGVLLAIQERDWIDVGVTAIRWFQILAWFCKLDDIVDAIVGANSSDS
jgi:hypothetical protein